MTYVDPHIAYARYSDNLTLTADTLALDGGTLETGYTLDSLRDNNPAKPTRLSTLQGMFKFHWATQVKPQLVSIYHANYQAGLTIHIEGNDTDSWGSPSFTHTITMPAWRVDRFPGQPWEDLSGITGWAPYHYWRVGTQTNNAVNVAVGEIRLDATVRRLNPDFAEGRKPSLHRPIIEHQTAYRRLRTQLGTTIRAVTGHIPNMTDSLAQDILDWIADADGRAFTFIPDAAADEVWMGLHVSTLQEMQDVLDHDARSLDLAIEEDGRGLEPSPSPL